MVGYDFFDVVDIEVIEGREFSRDFPNDALKKPDIGRTFVEIPRKHSHQRTSRSRVRPFHSDRKELTGLANDVLID